MSKFSTRLRQTVTGLLDGFLSYAACRSFKVSSTTASWYLASPCFFYYVQFLLCSVSMRRGQHHCHMFRLAVDTVQAVVGRPRRDANAVCEGKLRRAVGDNLPSLVRGADPPAHLWRAWEDFCGKVLGLRGTPSNVRVTAFRWRSGPYLRWFLSNHLFPRLLPRVCPSVTVRWSGRPFLT